MHVIECNSALGDVEGGIKLLNGLIVGKRVGEVDLPITVRIGEGAGGLHEKDGLAGDGIVGSAQSLQGSQIGVVEVGAQSEGAVAGEVVVQESSRSVELGRHVVPAKSGAAKGDALKR